MVGNPEVVEQGFEVAVVKDATAAAQLPGLDGYAAALTNFQMMANAVLTTAEYKPAVPDTRLRHQTNSTPQA